MDICYDGALVMPSSYAMMEEKEMSYVEGGVSVSLYSRSRDFNIYKVHYSSNECSTIAFIYGVIAGVSGIIGALTGPIGALAGGITAGCCTINAAVWGYAASLGGLNVYVPLLSSGSYYKKRKPRVVYC